LEILDDEDLDACCQKVEDSIKKMLGNRPQASQGLEKFLSSQYDTRLDNLLKEKQSSIHYLESGQKNKIILRKQNFFTQLK